MEYVEQRDGGFYILGKRISLDSVVYGFRNGDSPEAIHHSFPLLTLEEIYGAITFYLGHRAEIDAYLEQTHAEFEAARRAQVIPEDLRARLEQARVRLASRRRPHASWRTRT